MSAWDDPSAKAWVRHVIDDMVPKMESSSVVVSIAPEDAEGDVKFWVELGASIMLDKPIIVTVFGDRPVPRKLAQAADEILRCPNGVDLHASEALAAAIDRVTRAAQ